MILTHPLGIGLTAHRLADECPGPALTDPLELLT